MGGADGGGGQVVEHEVAARHGVERVLRHRGKAELLGHEAAIRVEVDARQRTRAQRQLAGELEDEREAAGVALELPEPGEQVVRQIHGLCALEVGVSGHRPVEVPLGEIDDHVEQVEQGPAVAVGVSADEHGHVGGHLVVARAGGVELAAHGADELGEAALDRHVDVLVVRVDLEAVVFDLRAHLPQAALELGEVLARDDVLTREHARVRERLLDVEGREPVVEPQRRVERSEERVLRLGEAGHEGGS